MKVIDLLNKIANKEELPTFIKVRDSIFGVSYKFDGKDLDYQLGNEEYYLSDYICKGGLSLNDEIEIMEEDKKIEKYDTGLGNGEWHEESVRKDILENKNIEDYLIRVMKEVDAVKFKTFEIIDKINKGE